MTDWTPKLGQLIQEYANADETYLSDVINPKSSAGGIFLRQTFNLLKLDSLKKKIKAEAGLDRAYIFQSQIFPLIEENNKNLADQLIRNKTVQLKIDEATKDQKKNRSLGNPTPGLRAIKQAEIEYGELGCEFQQVGDLKVADWTPKLEALIRKYDDYVGVQLTTELDSKISPEDAATSMKFNAAANGSPLLKEICMEAGWTTVGLEAEEKMIALAEENNNNAADKLKRTMAFSEHLSQALRDRTQQERKRYPGDTLVDLIKFARLKGIQY